MEDFQGLTVGELLAEFVANRSEELSAKADADPFETPLRRAHLARDAQILRAAAPFPKE